MKVNTMCYKHRWRAFLVLLIFLPAGAFAQLAPPTEPTLTVARSADAFVESIGVNGVGGPYVIPLPPDGKPYTPEQAKLYDTLPVDPKYLMGVRYQRIEGGRFPAGPFIRLYYDYGVRINTLVQWAFRDLTDPKNLGKCMTVLHSYPPDMIASIEGNNEANFWQMSGMKDFPATVAKAKTNQDVLYPAIKNDDMLRKIPVICFTIIPVNIGRKSEHQYAGLKTDCFDLESTHSYEFDTGASKVQLARTAMGVINACGPISDSVVPAENSFRPIVCTETGCTSDKPVAEATQTRMDPIILANNFAVGLPRTYLYGSWGNKPWDICGHPAGEAITQMISMLGEAKWDSPTHKWSYPKFQPGGLTYSIAPLPPGSEGRPVNVEHLLLQKSDGNFYMLIWNDVDIWNRKTNTLFNSPAVPVSFDFDLSNPLSGGTLYQLQEDGKITNSPLKLRSTAAGQKLVVEVSDSLTIIEMTPRGQLESTQKVLDGFSHSAASNTVESSAISPSGLTTVTIDHLKPVKTYKLRLTFTPAGTGNSGKAVDLLLQGTKVARDIDVNSERPSEYFATSDWRGRLCVQVMDAPGAACVLSKVEVLEPPSAR